MKKKFLTLICSLLAALLCFSAVACNNGGNGGSGGGNGGGTNPGGGRDYSTSIQIAYESKTAGSRQTAYRAIADYWNKNIFGKAIEGLNGGQKINFKIQASPVSSETLADMMKGESISYSLIELKEDGSQQVLALNQLDKIDTKEFDVSDISEALMAAYKMEYVPMNGDTYLNVSSKKADLYGLPSGTSPSVIFYNTTMMEKSGIAVISMTEEEIAAYNAANGTNYVARGYHVYSEKPDQALTISSTTYNEVNLYGEKQENVTGYRVFNNKIAMNWEELYALSAVLTPSYNQNNPGKASKRGFISEHWFWLGWSVGGDCLSYDEEAGTLQFTLGENNRNYMVVAENGVTINGKHFDKGDILDYNARKALATLEAGGTVKGETTVTKDDLTTENTGDNATVLYEIPSMRDAFTYFCASSSNQGSNSGHDKLHNKDVAGYGVARPVDDMNNDSFEKSFTEGSVAMMYRDFTIADKLGGKKDWNIAPAPQYKEFDENNNVKKVNNVEVKGYKASHGETTAYAIPKNAKNKNEAKVIMQWLASNEVQKMFLDYGSEPYYVANSATVNNDAEYKTKFANKWSKVTNFNVDVLIDSFNYVTPGDWAYTSNRSEWIAGWASFLHKQVETGAMSLDALFDTPQSTNNNKNYTDSTNEIVSKYPYLGIVSHKTVK